MFVVLVYFIFIQWGSRYVRQCYHQEKTALNVKVFLKHSNKSEREEYKVIYSVALAYSISKRFILYKHRESSKGDWDSNLLMSKWNSICTSFLIWQIKVTSNSSLIVREYDGYKRDRVEAGQMSWFNLEL